MGVVRIATYEIGEAEGMAMTVDHRALAVGYFNSTWVLIKRADRSPEQDRDMLASALASRQHWSEAGGTDDNLTVGDWQVAHVASLATWLQASTAEGMARAAACAGDREGYDNYAAEARDLLAQVDDKEDRELIESQLASIPAGS